MAAVIWYGCIAYKQFRETIHQGKLTEQALNETRESNERTQRAWVLVRDIKVEKDPYILRGFPPGVGLPPKVEPWVLKFVMGNSGESPGMVKLTVIQMRREPPPAAPEACPDLTSAEKKIATQLVPPKRDGFFFLAGIPWSVWLHQALHNEGGHDLTIHGIVHYADVFRKTRSSRFCFFLLPRTNEKNAIVTEDPPKQSAFGQCSFCNDWE